MKDMYVKGKGRRVEVRLSPNHADRYLKIDGKPFNCRKVVVEMEAGSIALVTVSFYPGDVAITGEAEVVEVSE